MGISWAKSGQVSGTAISPTSGEQYIGRYQVLTSTLPLVSELVNSAAPPSNALVGGYDSDNAPLYVCQAQFGGGLIPGKTRSNWKNCDVSWGGSEHWVSSYYVLVPQFKAPGTIFKAGTDSNGSVLGVCNAFYQTSQEDAEGDVVDAGPIGVPMYHRPDGSQCATPRAAGSCTTGNAGDLLVCSSDSDCTEGGTNGRCTSSGGGPAGCSCTYDACQTDADCGKGKLCLCHGSAYSYGGSTCMSGNCRVDSDCGVGEYCSPAQGTSSCGYVSGYYCHTQKDVCTNDSDCAGGLCTWSSASERWECQDGGFCN
jgi:hypothetical protein